MTQNPSGRYEFVWRQSMIIVELDAIIEFGHHIVGEAVQRLDIAGILVVGDAAVSLKTGWKLIGSKGWTRIAGHAT